MAASWQWQCASGCISRVDEKGYAKWRCWDWWWGDEARGMATVRNGDVLMVHRLVELGLTPLGLLADLGLCSQCLEQAAAARVGRLGEFVLIQLACWLPGAASGC